MRKLFLLFVPLFTAGIVNGQNVGIGIAEPANKLHVEGNMLVNTPTSKTSTAPTAGQEKTIVNATTIFFANTDSTGRVYDPGGPAANYPANITGFCNIVGPTNCVGIELTIETIQLASGDSLIIKEFSSSTTVLLAVGNGYTTTGKYIFNGGFLHITFKSNADANTGTGFSLLFKRLYDNSAALPAASGITGKAFFFDVKNGSLRGGFLNNKTQGLYSTGLGYNALASGNYSTAIGWNAEAIGNSSIAIGESTTASSFASTAFGYHTTAEGDRATALGNETTASAFASTSLGHFTTASGSLSVAMGHQTTASNYATLAMGIHSIASGYSSIAFGRNSTASGDTSLAAGYSALASGHTSLAMGYDVTSSGSYSTSFGKYSKATGYASTATGDSTTASGIMSFVGGFRSIASGQYAFAFGEEAEALGEHSIAIGYLVNATGNKSLAMGRILNVSGEGAMSIGNNSSATGDYAFTMGNGNFASGFSALALNSGTSASGNYSTAIGYYSRSRGYGGTVVGIYNDPIIASGQTSFNDATPLFIVGNGESDFDRSNAMVVRKDGKTGIGTNVPRTRLHVDGGTDASLSVSSGHFIIGDVNSLSLVFDDNEIIARSGSGNGTLYLQNEGGDFQVGGSAAKPGGGSWSATSDARLKQNIKPYSDGLQQLLKINPVQYQYNFLSGYDTQKQYIGVLAQDIQPIAPYMVSTFTKDKTEYLNVDNTAMTYMLINAVKELSKQNEELKSRLEKLEAAILKK